MLFVIGMNLVKYFKKSIQKLKEIEYGKYLNYIFIAVIFVTSWYQFKAEDTSLATFLWILILTGRRTFYLIKRKMSKVYVDIGSQCNRPILQERIPNRLLNRRRQRDFYLDVKAQYCRLIQEKIFRSHRGAMMMYDDAAATEKSISSLLHETQFYVLVTLCFLTVLDYIGAFFGLTVCSLTALTTKLFNKFHNPLRDYLRKQSTIFLKAASDWQKLNETAQCYLLRLEDPNISIPEMERLYMILADARAEITSNVVVASETYRRVTEEMTLDDLRRRSEGLDAFINYRNNGQIK